MTFKRLLNILSPQPAVAGLEINDLEIKFVQIKKGNIFSVSVKLEPDVVKEGKISNQDKFLEALNKLHRQITSKRKKKINAIVNILDQNVYTQMFSLPEAADDNLKEAAQLNLQMISPIDFNSAYSDWQIIGRNRSGQIEILGAFAAAELINQLTACLKQANFAAVAVEFLGLSLARLAAELGANTDSRPFVLFNVGNSGLGFSLVIGGNLYFNHFISWQSVYGEEREVPFESFKKLIIEEIKKVLNFYSTRWGGQVERIFVVTYGLKEEIIKIISQNFSFKVEPLTLKKFNDVSLIWFPALGSALRGLTARSQDTIISLAEVGTEKEFFKQQTVHFIEFWRNIALTTLAAVLIIFALADGFLIKTINDLNERFSNLSFGKQKETGEFQTLKEKIENINRKIDSAALVYSERSQWSSYLEKILKNSADGEIIIKRIFIQSLETPVLINAWAPSEQQALIFKEKLSADGNFSNIDLPIAKIISSAGGVEFSISFNLKR